MTARPRARRGGAVLEASAAGRACLAPCGPSRPCPSRVDGRCRRATGVASASATNAVQRRSPPAREARERAQVERLDLRRVVAGHRQDVAPARCPGGRSRPSRSHAAVEQRQRLRDGPLVVAARRCPRRRRRGSRSAASRGSGSARGRACPVARTTSSSARRRHQRVEQLLGPERRHAEALPELRPRGRPWRCRRRGAPPRARTPRCRR